MDWHRPWLAIILFVLGGFAIGALTVGNVQLSLLEQIAVYASWGLLCWGTSYIIQTYRARQDTSHKTTS